MKKCLLFCLLSCALFSHEYKVEVDNEEFSIVKVVIFPHEEVGDHRDDYPKIVIAIQGGVLTRLAPDGEERDIAFPTGVAVYRPVDPPGEMHRVVNRSDETIELLLIRLKT
jgi:quercetin dioxygenase-like cupin family protein